MPRTAFLSLLVLTSAGFAAAASGNLLGVNYSEWFPAATQMATDSSGALYLLASCAVSSGSASCVTKLSADGKTMLWQNVLTFQTNAMAVSPAGDVFVIPVTQPSDTSLHVVKLGAAGLGIAWTAATGFLPPANIGWPQVLTADSQGRTYVAALSGTTLLDDTGVGVTTVVRINAAGTAVDYSATMTGSPTAIAADGTGAVVVAGSVDTQACFVSHINGDGSTGYYTSLPQNESPALALNSSGNAVISGSQGINTGLLQRLNAAGAVVGSTSVAVTFPSDPHEPVPLSPLGVDSAGNAYILGLNSQLAPLQNSIAPCLPTTQPAGKFAGIAPLLTVVAPDGSVSQITYVPGASYPGSGNTDNLLFAIGPNSTIFVATGPAPGFVPTEQGPFPQGADILVRLSPQSAVQALPLTCVVSAATYLLWPVAPGEIVALYGSGLGPMQGMQTQATTQSAFPTQVSGVQVTFDGKPSPLLWVQNSQINAIVPWSLTPGTNTQICVSSGGTQTNCLSWPVAQTAPGVFTLDGTHAAALNQDGSINSAGNPARPGSIVSVFATGLGPINPASGDGTIVGTPLPANILPVNVMAEAYSIVGFPGVVQYNHAPVPLTFAGPAPYLVAGASQINFQLPTAGSAIPNPGGYYLSLPSTTSPDFVIYVTGQ